MKKEFDTTPFIRRLDSLDGNGRFYQGVQPDEIEYEKILWTYPSVTHVIQQVYPKGTYLIKYMRDNGMTGQVEFEKAGDEGTEVHINNDRLLHGEAVQTQGVEPKILKCTKAFLDWFADADPKILKSEQILANHDLRVAGTIDLLCDIGGELWLVDYKTSASLHDSQRVQVAAYWDTLKKEYPDREIKCALLHLGNKTKAKWSFADFEPAPFLDQFKHFRQTFDMLNPDAKPDETKYPEFFFIKDAPLAQQPKQ